jgi:hypothetical protein
VLPNRRHPERATAGWDEVRVDPVPSMFARPIVSALMSAQ